MHLSSATTLPFSRDSTIFHAFQEIWKEEMNEELSFERAEELGPQLLALIGAVARARRKEEASDIFRSYQDLWKEEMHEELTPKKAVKYGPRIIALVGAVARAKRMGWI